MPLIQLSPDELALAREIGTQRHDAKGAWATRYNHQKTTGIQASIDGVVGEMSYAKYWGLDVDHRLFGSGQGDGGTDLVFPKGVTVDVKASPLRRNAYLILDDLPPKMYIQRPHYYALCLNTDSETMFNLAGIVHAAEFIHRSRKIDFGHGERYGMHQSELHSPDGLRHIRSDGSTSGL